MIDLMIDFAKLIFIPRKWRPDIVRVSTLPNGVRVATRRTLLDPTTNIIALVGAGSRDEVVGDYPRGVAHFFEHMFFRGSYKLTQGEEKFTSGEVEQKIHMLGGTISAATAPDKTRYMVSVCLPRVWLKRFPVSPASCADPPWQKLKQRVSD